MSQAEYGSAHDTTSGGLGDVVAAAAERPVLAASS